MSLVRVKADFKAESEEELSLVKGQVVIVLEGDQNGWSKGEALGKRGWFPTGYTEPVEDDTPAPAPAPVQTPKSAPAPAADGPRGPVCDVCKKSIDDDAVVRWNLRLYHQTCLKCYKCSVPLDSASLIKKVGSDAHCNKCFDELMFGAAKQPKGRSLPNPALSAVAKAAASDGPRKTQSTRVVSPRAAVVAPGHASQNTEAAAIQARTEAAKARLNEAALKPVAPVVTVATAAAPAPTPAPAPVAPAEPAPKLAKLLYKQEAKTDAEISVDEGETVVVLTDDNEDWWLVRHGTLEGYVPRTYLEVLPALASPSDASVASAPAPHTNGAAKTSTSKPAAAATGDAPKQPKTNEERRVLVAEEILETERSYYKSLEAIVKFFLQPARKDNVISAADIKTLFGNIDDIRTIHKTVLESLERDAAEHKIAPGFLHMIKYLTLYTAYCKNHAAAASRLQELEKNSKVSAFLKAQKEAAGKGLDLASLLIMPVQRVPRYRLLFAELLKFTPEDHPELKELNECYAHILKIAEALNEGMRIADQQDKLAQLQKSFIGSCPPLVKLGRVLNKEGTLRKVCRKGTKDRYFFLFNDLLLYGLRLPTGSYTCHAASPIENVSITDVPDTAMQQNAFSILASPKSFTVLAETAEEKSGWMAAINKAIAADPRAAQKAKAPVWLPDNDAPQCSLCRSAFSLLHRRHHCRNCGGVVCSNCSKHEFKLEFSGKNERVCDRCYDMLYQEWRSGSARSRQSVYIPKPGGAK